MNNKPRRKIETPAQALDALRIIASYTDVVLAPFSREFAENYNGLKDYLNEQLTKSKSAENES